jgi:hypothetical protein
MLGLLLAASPAAADCNADNAIFEDDFEFLDGSWGPAADNFYVEDGVLVTKNGGGRVNFQASNEAADLITLRLGSSFGGRIGTTITPWVTGAGALSRSAGE